MCKFRLEGNITISKNEFFDLKVSEFELEEIQTNDFVNIEDLMDFQEELYEEMSKQKTIPSVRNVDDISGMTQDLIAMYEKLTTQELVDLVMTLRHQDQDTKDLIEDWTNFCNGTVVG